MFERVPSSTLRSQLARLLDRATLDNTPVRVHRSRGRPDAVVLKAERYDALVATEAEHKALSTQHVSPQYFVPLRPEDLEVVPWDGELAPGVDPDTMNLDLPRRRRPHVKDSAQAPD